MSNESLSLIFAFIRLRRNKHPVAHVCDLKVKKMLQVVSLGLSTCAYELSTSPGPSTRPPRVISARLDAFYIFSVKSIQGACEQGRPFVSISKLC